MRIFVPSRGRPDICMGVPRALPERFWDDIRIVIRPDEQKLYAKVPFKKLILSKGVNGLSATRQWILEYAAGLRDRVHVQIDDDITAFTVKHDIRKWTIRKADESDVKVLFSTMYRWVKSGDVVIASTQDRVGLARPSSVPFRNYTRIGQVMFINARECLSHDWRFDRVKIYADQDMALQIVRGGGVTRTSHIWGHNMKPIYAPGGVSLYRDQKCINQSLKKLMKLHPGLVKARWKKKHGYKVPSRIISFKKAREEGVANERTSTHTRRR